MVRPGPYFAHTGAARPVRGATAMLGGNVIRVPPSGAKTNTLGEF